MDLESEDFCIVKLERIEESQNIELREYKQEILERSNPPIATPKQIERICLSHSVVESSKHCEVGKSNKLSGLQNYNVWKIKMEAVFRQEKVWSQV